MTKFGLTNVDRNYAVQNAGSAQVGAANEDDRPFAEIRRNLQDAMRMLSQHRWAFFVPTCIVTSAAFVLSLYYPRTYTASTTFERRNDPIMVNLPNSVGAASSQYFRSTTSRDIKSVTNMAEVVEALGLTKGMVRLENGDLDKTSKRRRDSLAASLASTIDVSTVSPNKDIDVIKLNYTGADPTIGARLLDAVKIAYVSHTMAWMEQFLHSQRDYYVDELDAADERLKSAKRADTQLRLEMPYVDPRDPSGISTQLAQLEAERRDLMARRREYEVELSGAQQLMAGMEAQKPIEGITRAVVIPEQLLSRKAIALAADIHRVEIKIESLRQTRGMTDKHPEVSALLGRREWLVSALTEQENVDMQAVVTKTGSFDPGAISIGRPRSAEQVRLFVSIGQQQSKLKDVELDLTANEAALARLTEAKSTVFLKQETIADIASEMGRAQREHARLAETVSQIEPAIKAIEQNRMLHFPPSKPARGSSIPLNPKASTIIILAVMAGVAVGVVFVILAEILDRVFRSSTQVARTLGLPILDVIDEIVTTQDRRRNLIRRTVLAPLALACCLGVTFGTGSLAFLSLQHPWTYQRIQQIPEDAIKYIAEVGEPESQPDKPRVS